MVTKKERPRGLSNVKGVNKWIIIGLLILSLVGNVMLSGIIRNSQEQNKKLELEKLDYQERISTLEGEYQSCEKQLNDLGNKYKLCEMKEENLEYFYMVEKSKRETCEEQVKNISNSLQSCESHVTDLKNKYENCENQLTNFNKKDTSEQIVSLNSFITNNYLAFRAFRYRYEELIYSAYRPSEGAKWLTVDVLVTNVGKTQKELPYCSYFKLLYANEQLNARYCGIEGEGILFEREIFPGVTKQYWVAFEVPKSIALSETIFSVEYYGKTMKWRLEE